jgi:hypothetical protein
VKWHQLFSVDDLSGTKRFGVAFGSM